MASFQSEAVRAHWAAARLVTDAPEAVPAHIAVQDGESWGDLTAEPRAVDYLEREICGLPAMWLVPHQADHSRVLLCFHGGGFVSGSIYTHRKMFGHLAKAAGVRALLFDYPLASARPHPTQVEESVHVYQWLLDQGIRPGRIAFCGDSCGGALAITAQLRARQRGLPVPAAALAFSPWVDMAAAGESFTANRDSDAFFTAELVRALASNFLGRDGDPRDPLANPLFGDLTGLGPIYIQVGGDEVLLDDARQLTEHARRCGVEARLEVFAQMQHTFQMAAGRAPEADEAIRKMAEWVRPLLGLSARLEGMYVDA